MEITYIGKGFLLLTYIIFMMWASWRLTLVVTVFFLLLSVGLHPSQSECVSVERQSEFVSVESDLASV